MNDDNILVSAGGVTKTYTAGKLEVPALRGVTMDVRQGEFLSIVGPSGSGKTTLLNLIGALDSITGGQLRVLGRDMADHSRRQRGRSHRQGDRKDGGEHGQDSRSTEAQRR